MRKIPEEPWYRKALTVNLQCCHNFSVCSGWYQAIVKKICNSHPCRSKSVHPSPRPNQLECLRYSLPPQSLLYNNWSGSALQIKLEIICFLLGLLLWRQRQIIRDQLEELRLNQSLWFPLIKFPTQNLGRLVTADRNSVKLQFQTKGWAKAVVCYIVWCISPAWADLPRVVENSSRRLGIPVPNNAFL